MNNRTRHDDPPTTQVPFYLTDEGPQSVPTTLLDRCYTVALVGVSVGVVLGAARWLWANFGEQIAAFFWSAVTLAY